MMDKFDKAFYTIIIIFSILFIMFSLLLFRYVFIMGEEAIKRELKNEQVIESTTREITENSNVEQNLGVINGK